MKGDACKDKLNETMSTEWTFKLIVNNKTKMEFEVMTSDISWGYWYLNNVDNTKPIAIKPNSQSEVFALRAHEGTMTGYQGTCVWKCPGTTIALMVEVPYMSSENHSSLELSGSYVVEGWKPLEKGKHQFIRTITISDLT